MNGISLLTLNEGSKDLIDDPVLSLVPGMLQANPVYRGSQDDDIFYSFINRIVIKPHNGLGSQGIMDQLKGYDAVIKQNEYDSSVYEIVFNRPFEKVLSIANNLCEKGICEFAEPDWLMFGELTQSDPTNDTYSHQQWAIKNTGGSGQYGFQNDADMDLDEAWTITEGCDNIKVAIIDTGVDLGHEDLDGNFSGIQQDFTGTGGYGSYFDNQNHYRYNGHGTLLAGIVCGEKNNSMGISGAAPGVKFNSGKIYYFPSNNVLTFQSSWAANGINWAKNNADIINLSFKCESSGNITNAINSAITSGRGGKGCVVVAAAGNDEGNIKYPSTLSGVIAVGNSTPCDSLKHHGDVCGGVEIGIKGSNFGTGMDVVAPGTWIITTDIRDTLGWDMLCEENEYTSRYGITDTLKSYTQLDGTSLSAPYVASIAALMLSVNPNLTQTQVKRIIESTTDRRQGEYTYTMGAGERPDLRWSPKMGYGRVNAKKALDSLTNGILNGPSFVCPSGAGPYSITFYNTNPNDLVWTSSNNIYLTGSGFSRYAYLTDATVSDQPGWIKVKVNGSCQEFTKNVTVGKYIDGTVLTNGQTRPLYSTCLVYPGQSTVTLTKPSGASSYSWTKVSGTVNYWYTQQNGKKMIFSMNYGNTATFNVSTYTAECGTIYRNNIIFVAVLGGYGYTIFPNPSENEMSVEVTLDNNVEIPTEDLKEIEIRVYDSNERLVKTVFNKEGFKTITLSTIDLKPGFYILNITNMDQIVRKRIIIK